MQNCTSVTQCKPIHMCPECLNSTKVKCYLCPLCHLQSSQIFSVLWGGKMLPTCIPLLCLPSLSWTTSLFILSSCSLSSPNNEAVVIDVNSFDSEMAVTFGCHVLSRYFNILMFSSSLSKVLPRLIKWFTIWENLLCTSQMVSPFCFLKSSYSLIRACFLACLTSFVPSCVTSRMSHIFFAEMHYDTCLLYTSPSPRD